MLLLLLLPQQQLLVQVRNEPENVFERVHTNGSINFSKLNPPQSKLNVEHWREVGWIGAAAAAAARGAHPQTERRNGTDWLNAQVSLSPSLPPSLPTELRFLPLLLLLLLLYVVLQRKGAAVLRCSTQQHKPTYSTYVQWVHVYLWTGFITKFKENNCISKAKKHKFLNTLKNISYL